MIIKRNDSVILIWYLTITDDWNLSRNLSVSSELLQARVTSLLPAHSYHIRVSAGNQVGISEPSASLALTTEEATPTASPSNVDVSPESSTELRVEWLDPPLEARNGIIMGYYIGYKISNDSNKHRIVTVTRDAEKQKVLHEINSLPKTKPWNTDRPTNLRTDEDDI